MVCSKCGRPGEDVCGYPPLCGECYDIEKKIQESGNIVLKDSGGKRTSATGSVRDDATGKGRCDLLPLDIVSGIIASPEVMFIEKFKETKYIANLAEAIKCFAARENKDVYTLMLEVSQHYKAGAIKYGENNWQKGQPLTWYLSSAVRHLLEYLRGDRDEPHDLAFMWNTMNAAWTCIHKPELDDIGIKEVAKHET